MSKSIYPASKTAATMNLLTTGNAFTLVDLYTFTLLDGTVIYLTSFDRDVVYNSQTYTSMGPRLRRSTFSYKRGVETSEAQIWLYYDNLTDLVELGLNYGAAVIESLFDGGTIVVQRGFNPVLLANGTYSIDASPYGVMILFSGYVGDAIVGRTSINFHIVSSMALLNIQTPQYLYAAQCRWLLYSSGVGGACNVVKAQFGVSGTAQNGSTESLIYLPAGLVIPAGAPNAGAALPTNWLSLGSLTFTSGANKGLSRSIQQHVAPGVSNYPNVVLRDQPLGYWRFGDPAGSSTVADSSGNGYTGTVNGGVTLGEPGALTGDSTTCALFDGATGYINLPVPAPWTLAGYQAAITIEFWIKPNTPPSNAQGFKGLFCSQQDGKWPLRQYAYWNGAVAQYGPSGFEWVPASPFIDYNGTPNVWQHVVVVFQNGNFIMLYVNGAPQGGGGEASYGSLEWAYLEIGRCLALNTEPAGQSEFYAGYVQEVAVYGYPLSSWQVAEHYAAGTTAPSTITVGWVSLLQYFPFPPAPGDSFEAYAGCDWTLHTCINRFNNKINFGGTPYIPVDENTV